MTTKITIPAHGWRPRDYQMPAWTAIEKGTKEIVLVHSRRAGKDALALQAMAVRALQRPGQYFYTLPLYTQVRRAIYTAVDAGTGRNRVEDVFIPEIVSKKEDQQMLITLANNSTVQFVGSDNFESLIGSGPCGIVYSEAAQCDPACFGMLRPMLTFNNGWNIKIGTPRGKNHFHTQYNMALTDPDAFAEKVTAEQTGLLTPEQLSRERRDYIAEYGSAMGNAMFAQEYYVSFEAAVLGAVFGEELADLRSANRLGKCVYDPRFAVHCSFDIGVSDLTVVCFFQDIGNEYRMIDYYANNANGMEHYVRMLAAKPYSYGDIYMPHDGSNRSFASGVSPIQVAKQLGISMKRVPQTDKRIQYAAGAQMLRRTVFHVDGDMLDGSTPDHTKQQSCEYVLEALSQYRFEYDSARKILSTTARHDWTSHFADAFMTYAVARSNARAFNPQPTVQSFEKPMRLSQMRQRGSNQTGAWG